MFFDSLINRTCAVLVIVGCEQIRDSGSWLRQSISGYNENMNNKGVVTLMRDPIILKLRNNTYYVTFHEDGTATATSEKKKNGISVCIKFTNCPEGHERTIEAAKALYIKS